MKTNLNNLIFFCVMWVSICFAIVYCDKDENVKHIVQFFGQSNNSYWFVNTEEANVVLPNRDSEDRFLNTTQLVTKYGYKAQEHSLTTKDDYILNAIRIVGKGPVVFLMHGFLGSSDDFVVSGPSKGLAYLLADKGYDVWLGNARGNKYSRSHMFLNPELEPFWKFSWHEIGVIDVPTMVDHALMVSGAKQVTYIGHSQGSTVFFVLNSERPEYNKKFNLMISLGTVAWIWHLNTPEFQALQSVPDAQFELMENLGLYEILSANSIFNFINTRVCCTSTVTLLACLAFLFHFGGFDYDQVDYENVCVQLAHAPSGSSLRQLQHFVQLGRSREFAQFDFGRNKNLVVYGCPTPPSYDVEKITVPVAMFYGANDFVSRLDDTLILKQRLPNVLSLKRVPHFQFNHYDFIWAKDVKQLLYWKILDIIAENVPGCYGLHHNNV